MKLTDHVVAAAILLEINAALRTRLCPHAPNGRFRLYIFVVLLFVATVVGMPGASARKAHSMVAIGAMNLVLLNALRLARFLGEVTSALRI